MVQLVDYRGREVSSFAEAPPMGEVATVGSAILGNMLLLPYNPDDLVRSKGLGLKVYQEMIREPYIKGPLIQKKTKLLNIGWDVLPASDDPVHLEQAEFVKWNLKTYIKGSFLKDLFEMCDAIDNGFSVSEKVYDRVKKNGKWKGKIAIKTIKSRDPNHFEFKTDKHGNLGRKGLIHRPGMAQQKPLSVDKFVIFSYMMRYENHYGTSDLRAAYRAYWIKDTAWKLRCIYMERYSGNNLLGKYPGNDPTAKDKLLEIFRTWQQETGMAIPEGMEVEVLNLATSSKSEYESTMNDCNREMQICILGQTLTMDVGQKGTGSRALGQVHAGVSLDQVIFLDALLAMEVNEQIVQDIIDWNYDPPDAYPTWYFRSRENFDGKAFSETLEKLNPYDLGIPKQWVREKYRIPAAENGEEVIKAKPAPVAPVVPGQEPKPAKPAAVLAMEEGATKETPLDGPYYRGLDRFELFSEIHRVDRETSALISETSAASTPLYDAMKLEVLSLVESKRLFENRDFAYIEKVTVKVGPLKQLIADSMLRAELMGRADIDKITGRTPDKLAEAPEDYTPDEAIAALALKTGYTKAEFDILIAEVKGRAFTVAGLEKNTIDREVQVLLLQSLKSGDDFAAFKHRLNEAFIKYAMPVYGEVGLVGEKILNHHAETVFRTNVMDAYNQGRKKVLDDDDVKEAFPAWRISEIIDGRTRPSHARADGLTFMADDPVWQKITCPNGYNCRGVILPISKFDFTRDMLSNPGDIPADYPDPGFK